MTVTQAKMAGKSPMPSRPGSILIKKHQMNSMTSENANMVNESAASFRVNVSPFWVAFARVWHATTAALEDTAALGQPIALLVSGSLVPRGSPLVARARQKQQAAASSAMQMACAMQGSMGTKRNGSHCRHAAPDTMSRASRRSSCARRLPHDSVPHAINQPMPAPVSQERATGAVGHRPASNAAQAEQAAPAIPESTRTVRRFRREPSFVQGLFNALIAVMPTNSIAATSVAVRKSGSCTRPPAYSTWSRNTPSKQKSSSTHANMQARPSRADACPRMAARGRNVFSRDSLGWRLPLFRARAIVEASVSTVSPFDGSSRCMLDTRPVLSACMLWPPTPPFSPERSTFVPVGSDVFLAMCSITLPIVIWRALVCIRCGLCLRAWCAVIEARHGLQQGRRRFVGRPPFHSSD